ncbi:MAG: hypothetical protein IKO35_04460, partial [Elusimicrobiaceae bacterium]|nr:hypothetical protein [Elusimicrobiaceae bacterium]
LYRYIYRYADRNGTPAQQELANILTQKKERKTNQRLQQMLIEVVENGWPAYGTPLYQNAQKYANPNGSALQQDLYLLQEENRAQNLEKMYRKILVEALKEDAFATDHSLLYNRVQRYADPNGTPTQQRLYRFKELNRKNAAGRSPKEWVAYIQENGFPRCGSLEYHSVLYIANPNGTPSQRELFRLKEEKERKPLPSTPQEALEEVQTNGFPKPGIPLYWNIFRHADPNGTPAQQELSKLLKEQNKKQKPRKKTFSKDDLAAKQIVIEILENGYPELHSPLYQRAMRRTDPNGTFFEQELDRLLQERQAQQESQKATEILLETLEKGFPKPGTLLYRNIIQHADSKGTAAQKILSRMLFESDKK